MKTNVRRLLPLLLLASCTGDPSGIEPGDVLMTVSVDESAPPPEANVDVQVQNRAERTVYVLDHCGSIVTPRFERRVAGEWVYAPFGIPCLAVVTPPIELAPDATAAGSIPIHEPGHYRSTVRLRTAADEEVIEVRHEFTVD